MRRSNEPVFWALFSGGGMALALVAPALILVTGFLVPMELVSFDRLHAVLTHPLGRLAVFGLAFLTFFHWAHRFRHTLLEVGLRTFAIPLAIVCYSAALAGTVWAAYVALA